MQGTGADLIKLATRLVLQVRDELMLEVPESELERATANVRGLMTNVAKLDVLLVAEPGWR